MSANGNLSSTARALIEAAKARRTAAGLAVETVSYGSTATQYFADTGSRDEFMARAIRCGVSATIKTA